MADVTVETIEEHAELLLEKTHEADREMSELLELLAELAKPPPDISRSP